MVSHYKVTIYTCLESYISPIQALRNVILANLLSSHIWSSLLSNLSVNNIVSVIVSWGPGLYIQWHKVQAWATNSYLGITRVELQMATHSPRYVTFCICPPKHYGLCSSEKIISLTYTLGWTSMLLLLISPSNHDKYWFVCIAVIRWDTQNLNFALLLVCFLLSCGGAEYMRGAWQT